MVSVRSSLSRPMPARRLLAILATIAMLTVVGHFVADAANLWLITTSPAMTNQDLPHASVTSADTTFSLHTGFRMPLLQAIAAPVVFVPLRVFARTFSLFQYSFSPLRPPKVS